MEKKIIKRTKGWSSKFYLTGKAVLGKYTYKIDEKSNNSDWVYNSLNLGVNCGEKFGVVYCEGMGGYSSNPEAENVCYAHGKDAEGRDDFTNKITVPWEERFDQTVLDEIGDNSFIEVALQQTNKGGLIVEKFLSMYDAIAYVNDNLKDGMVINVRGDLKYSLYNGKVQVKKQIKSIKLNTYENPKFTANFTQTLLLDKDSVDLKDIDKDKGVLYVNAKVLDYLKEYNGVEVKSQYPFNKQFEFEIDVNNEKKYKAQYEKYFKVKKDITQITFDGNFIEGGATVLATWEDVPDDIKELVALEMFTEEEAIATCSTNNGNKERRMVLTIPTIKKDEKGIPFIQKTESQFEEEDLIFDLDISGNATEEDNEPPFDVEEKEEELDIDLDDLL